jgi:hypothetical protein
MDIDVDAILADIDYETEDSSEESRLPVRLMIQADSDDFAVTLAENLRHASATVYQVLGHRRSLRRGHDRS